MRHPFDLTGRTILVTGASSGLGRATAIGLSQLGARLIIVARNVERLQATLCQLHGDDNAPEIVNLSQYEALPDWMRGVAQRYGKIDAVAHCAGLQITAPLKVIEAASTEELWRTNVSASLWLAKAFRQRGVNNSGGALVYLASAVGLVGQPALSAYSASKGALIAMARSLALELAREGIRVNCVAPGYIKTEMTAEFAAMVSEEHLKKMEADYPLGFGQATDVANAVAYLVSPAARWITGTTLVVDGGYTAH